MNVPADALLELAFMSGAPTTLRAEGVVRWATEMVRSLERRPGYVEHERLRVAAEETLQYLTDPKNTDHKAAVERLRAALKGT